MFRKKSEQKSPRLSRRKVEKICAKCNLVPISAELNASDGDEWFHLRGNAALVGCFLKGEGCPAAKWELDSDTFCVAGVFTEQAPIYVANEASCEERERRSDNNQSMRAKQ